jgi:hypothetical protein
VHGVLKLYMNLLFACGCHNHQVGFSYAFGPRGGGIFADDRVVIGVDIGATVASRGAPGPSYQVSPGRLVQNQCWFDRLVVVH